MRWLTCSVFTAVVLAGTACTSAKRYIQRGQTAFDAGKYEDASLNFRNAIQKDPKLAEAYYKLGLTDLRLNRPRDAFQLLRQAATRMPKDHQVQVTFGEVCLQLYQTDPKRPKVLYDEVTKLVAGLKAEDPKGYDTLRFQGYLNFIDRKTKDGIADLESANAIKPYEPQVVFPLVRALIENQRAAEAEKLAKDTIQRHKDYLPLYGELFQYYAATNRLDQAEGVLKSQIANNPKRAEYVVELANFYSRFHRDAEANALLKGVLDHASDYPRAYLLVANYYALNSDWPDATRLLEEGARLYPRDKLIYEKDLTNIFLAQGNKPEASRMVDQILREAPKDAEVLRLQAILLLDTRQPENIDKASAQLQDVVQQTPRDNISRFNLARAYLMKGERENARKELVDCVRSSPRFVEAHILLAEIMLQVQEFQDALSEATVALAIQPANPRARLLEVLALNSLGRPVEARNKLNPLIKDYPRFAEAQLELGFMEMTGKKLPEAEEVFRKLYDSGQVYPRSLEGLVQVLLARGQTDQAMRLLNAEASKPGAPAAVRILLARTAGRTGKTSVAVDQLRLAVKQDPNSYDAHMLLADYLRGSGELNEAMQMYQKAADLTPKNPAPEVLLAVTEDLAGNKAEAIKAYRAALARRPDDPVILNDLAFYLTDNGGSLDEALTLSQRAVKKVNSPNFSDTLGWIYLKKNQPENALVIFQNLVRKNPANPVFQYHVGAALAAKGDKSGARAALESALQKKPRKQAETKIRELLAQIN